MTTEFSKLMKNLLLAFLLTFGFAFGQPTTPINNARFTGTSLINSGAFLYAASGGTIGVQSGGAFYFQTGGTFTGDVPAFVSTLTGTASININGTVGATTPSTGAFTTLSATGDVTLTGTTGTAGHGWITGPSVAGKDLRLAAGNATGGVSIRDSGANQIGYFTSTGLAVAGALSATGQVIAIGAGNTGSAAFRSSFSGAATRGLELSDSTDTSSANFVYFEKASGAAIGSITRVTTTDAVAYNTTSDGRLKTDIRDFTGEDSGRIIDALKPRWFNWKPNTLTETYEEQVPVDAPAGRATPDARIKTVTKSRPVTDKARLAKHEEDNKGIIGFIAQEEAQADPAIVRIGAVTPGDNNPEVITKQWARSDAALVPILVAEIKALRARVSALEAKLK